MIEPATSEVPPERESASTGLQKTVPPSGDRLSLYGELEPEELNKRLFAMARAAVTHAESSDLSKRRSAMARSYRAYANQHAEGSKYNHKNYSSRSKLHVPKTRAAVKNKMVAAHAALFGTDDVVAISAEDDTDQAQQASAELNKALLNYRLDRTNHKAGVPWFRIALGASLDAAVAGICLTKQYWQFKEAMKEISEEEAATIDPNDPATHADMDLAVVGMNGRPMRRKTVRDRPMIEPHAPENVICDMAAPWWDVVQEGAFFIVRIPMHVGDVKAMMKPGAQHMGGGPWFQIPEKVMASAVSDVTGTSVRTARNQGTDRYARTSTPPVNDFDIVWVHENFVRLNDCDYHFWTLGTKQLLSEPGEVGTRGHYPAHRGERPYVMGVGAIEPHNALPMSHVEAWRPLQDEINDTRNLRLDTMKQSIAPIAVYRRGANVDLRAVRERGPDATIQVSDLEKDLKFERATGPDASSFAETDRLNGEFDELAGSFATSTVGSSRAIGETARGMQLVSSSANTVQEFDLQVFLQTWAEPVLRHVVWLEQYYETDRTLLALMAKKANVYQRFGVTEEVDQLLERQITVRVNLGPGAGDPNQKMARLTQALGLAGQVMPFVPGQVKPKGEEVFKEIFAPTGISAGRLFSFTSPEEAAQNQPPTPEAIEMQANQEKATLEREKMQLTRDLKQLDLQIAQEKNALERERMELEREKMHRELDRINRELDLKASDADFTHSMADREFGLKEQTGQREFGLKAATHNRQLVEEATGEAEKALTPHTAREPLPVETAMTEAVGQFQQIMAMLAEGQRQQSETINLVAQQMGALAQAQADNTEMLREIVAYQRAPRRIIRDASGQVAGVEIGNETQPVVRGDGGQIEGI